MMLFLILQSAHTVIPMEQIFTMIINHNRRHYDLKAHREVKEIELGSLLITQGTVTSTQYFLML